MKSLFSIHGSAIYRQDQPSFETKSFEQGFRDFALVECGQAIELLSMVEFMRIAWKYRQTDEGMKWLAMPDFCQKIIDDMEKK